MRTALPGLLAAGLALTGGTAPAAPPRTTPAANRTYIVTDFDSVRVEAPIAVAVQSGRGVTARGEGDRDMLERVDLNVSGRILTVRLKPSPFEGRRGDNEGMIRLFLTTPSLRRAHLAGSGALAVSGMKALNGEILATGSGALSAAGVNADTLTVAQQGSGTLTIAGKAGKATVQLSGSGSIDTGGLTAPDVEVTAEGAGSVKALATRAAKVTAIGAASVTIDGHPACTVRHAGSGTVTCANETY